MSYYPNEEAVKWFVAKIWPRVKEKEPSAKFVVVGRDPSENLMNFLQNAKDVFATGNVKSVDEFYDSAALVVVPIISGGGVNVKILEALGAGKIVVTTHKGIEGTDFIAGQHLFVENTAESFSDRVIDILQNSKKYDYISNNAFKYCCEHYSWSQTCKPMIDVMSN